MRIVLATHNEGKLKEFRAFMAPYGYEIVSLRDIGVGVVVPEEGDRFADIARQKARAIVQLVDVPVLADDSGLCVDALGGAPGVYSARYAGVGATDADNIQKLVDDVRATVGVPWDMDGERVWSRAQFVCALALCTPHRCIDVVGTCDGAMTAHPRGTNGFGYDPVFYVPSLRCTCAQLTRAQKADISHRGAALRRLIARLDADAI